MEVGNTNNIMEMWNSGGRPSWTMLMELIFHMIVWHIQEDRMHKKLKLKQGVQNSEANYLHNSFLFSCHHQYALSTSTYTLSWRRSNRTVFARSRHIMEHRWSWEEVCPPEHNRWQTLQMVTEVHLTNELPHFHVFSFFACYIQYTLLITNLS